jgi:hypothetical protein
MANARPMPTQESLGTDDRKNLQDPWKQAIHLDKEPTIIARQPDAAAQLTPQNNQLMSKSAFSASSRLIDLSGDAKMAKTKLSNPRSFRQLTRFRDVINAAKVFSTHRRLNLIEQVDERIGLKQAQSHSAKAH